MYPPPPGMKKLRSQVNVTFWFWLMYPPPPRNEKVEISGQCDILVLADVPPQGMKNLRSQVNMTFWFWWSAGLVNGLEPHPQPLSSQKNEMLVFGLCSTSDDWPCCLMDSNTIYHPSPAKKSEMLIFGLRSTSDDRLGWSMDSNTTCHPSPAKKSEMLIFGLCSTSHGGLGLSMDSNPICHPSPVKKLKCSFLDYVELVVIGRAGWWTQTPSATLLQPKM